MSYLGDVAALGITNQRETTILWERKTGKPVHNAIVWQDRRTAPICKKLWEQGLEELVRKRRVADRCLLLRKQDHVDSRQCQRREREGRTAESWLLEPLTAG